MKIILGSAAVVLLLVLAEVMSILAAKAASSTEYADDKIAGIQMSLGGHL